MALGIKGFLPSRPQRRQRFDLTNPQYLLAQALKKGISTGPARGGWTEGLSRLGQAFIAKQAKDKAEKQFKQREADYDARVLARNTALKTALGQMQPREVPLPTTGAAPRYGMAPGDLQGAIQTLGGNQDLAEMAFELQGKELANRRSLAADNLKHERSLTADNLAHSRAIELKGTPGARTPVPGVDVPFTADVFGQQTQLAETKSRAAQALKPPPTILMKRYYEGRDAIASGGEAIRALRTALELSPKAYEGGMADARAAVVKDWLGSGGIGVLPEGADEGAIATGRMTQKVQSQALSQLKLIFGGMPTEGERAMLLKVQGSANLPKAEREQIWTDAIAMAERSIAIKKAEGNVFEKQFPSYKVPTVATSGGGTRPASVSQEVWDAMTPAEKALF